MPLIQPVVGAAPSQPVLSPAPRRPLRSLLRYTIGLLFVASSLLLTVWLTLHWGILPRIEQWRPQIEMQASRVLGVPVRIGRIEASSSGWVPRFELHDVTLLDAQQRAALQLPRVVAAISPQSLVALELRFEQLLVDGPQLEIRRDTAGRVFVAGLTMGAADGGEDGGLRDWFFRQHEFVIRDGSLYWTDELRGAPTLALTNVQFALRNSLLHHDVRLDATPDDPWGERFNMRGRFAQPLLARPGDMRRWSGTAFVDMPRMDVHELRRYVDLPFELNEGDGALRAWIELDRGRPRSGTVDLALRAVSLRLAQHVEPLVVEQVQGRLVAKRDDEGVAISLHDFGFLTGDGVRWPSGDLSLAWRQREGRPISGGEFSAQRLDLNVMSQIAARVPLGEAMRRLLAELNPQGVVSGLSANWSGPLDAPTRYQAKALFSGLSLAAKPSGEPDGVGRPGLRNATLQVSATEAGGQAQLSVAAGALEFPGVFDDPVVPFDTLAAQLAWRIDAGAGGATPKVSVTVEEGKFANADAQGDLTATWSTGPGEGLAKGGRYPGQFELSGRIVRGNAGKIPRYLPLRMPGARQYLGRAIRAGTVLDASFRVKGDLWEFPFYGAKSAREGEFRIAGRVEDATFDYVPSEPAIEDQPAWISPWPAFTKVAGMLIIDRSTLEIRDTRAQLGNVAFGPVNGGIRNLADRSVLALDGTARGPLTEMLRFVNATPVGQWTGQALSRASASGNAELKLALALPLYDLSASTVQGSLALGGNDLRLTPDTPMLAAARGRVDFTQKGVTVSGATARLLGGEASFDGSTQPDGSLRFSGQGTASAEGLRRATELGALSRLASSFSGQAGYRASLGFVHGLPELNITSNLVGMASDLPVPLRKAAETALPLRFQTTLAPESLQAGQTARDTLRLELGTLVQAQFQRDLSGDVLRVLRGGIGLNEAAPQPASGVHLHANFAVLPLDAWEAAVERLSGGSMAGGAPAGEMGGYLPTQIALRAQTLTTGARQFNRVVIGASQEEGQWRANVEAEQFGGYVEYRPARPGAAPAAGRVYARLARLSLPKSEAEQVETLLDQQQPTAVPSLDIVIDDFELRGKRLGRVEVDAVNRIVGEGRDAVREWRLNRLALSMPEAQLVGSGRWAEVGGTFMTLPGAAASVRRRSVLDFSLDVADGGALLERLGTGKAVRGGKGQLSGQLSWLGSPLALDYPTLSGNVAVAIDAGQFLKADPGAARLLGVLSLQALPRRLALDFRDVFQEGFAFDNLSGDLKISHGVATTNNLRMRGVQAVVLMEGQADIARETQDLRVVVVPEINAGTASLAYAAINPAVGLGTFLAQMFLRRPLTAAGTREFHVSGSWADPKVEKVERKIGDAVPELDAPASAPSAPRSTAQ
ncbi:YhdP family protein [uncultured Piscinibacter sp.]|uniref:YhdP family protein n=1 Tax=uncultured Piscinibacter sp. TaxID=1131835 RepID=UPI00262B5849|nr:YhdP family protein [uncultured Piscinibacter sp.]